MGQTLKLSPPHPISGDEHVDAFTCGNFSLDTWLQQRALRNQRSGASRTFVVCRGRQVVAYYALASSAIATHAAPSRFRRNMPNPIPVVMLGRLAVDRAWQGQGFGRALVRDAGLRVAQAADSIGIRGIVVQALTVDAKALYEKVGFDPSPVDPMILLITLADLSACM